MSRAWKDGRVLPVETWVQVGSTTGRKGQQGRREESQAVITVTTWMVNVHPPRVQVGGTGRVSTVTAHVGTALFPGATLALSY